MGNIRKDVEEREERDERNAVQNPAVQRDACITTKFKFGQQVWFIEGNRICHGKIREIHEKLHGLHYWHQEVFFALDFENDNGLGSIIKVNADYCFESRQELIDTLLK